MKGDWVDYMALNYLCDLTPARLEYLRLAARGELKVMNGATHDAMRELIGPKSEGYPLTAYGDEILQRAELVISGKLPEDIGWRDVVEYTQSYQRAVRRVYPQFQSYHIKMMVGLFRGPGQTWGHLMHGYGGKAVNELIQLGAIRTTHGISIGSQCFLTELGENVIRCV